MTRPPLAGAVGVADWGWSRLYPGFIVATDFDHPQSASADSPPPARQIRNRADMHGHCRR